MFLVTACLTAIGAVVPASVAIIAPIGMGFAVRYKINPLMMGLLIINGASAGGFSPISIFGSITNGVVENAGLPGNPTLLFLASFFYNLAISIVAFLMWGGRDLLRRRVVDTGLTVLEADSGGSGPGGAGSGRAGSSGAGSDGVGSDGTGSGVDVATDPGARPTSDSDGSSPRRTATHRRAAAPSPPTAHGRPARPSWPAPPPLPRPAPTRPRTGSAVALDRHRLMTLVGLLALAVAALFFDLNVGLVAMTVAVVLTLLSPESAKNAVNHVAWPTVLLVCGIVMYVGVMQSIGTIDWLGEEVATVGAPLLAALVICFIGGCRVGVRLDDRHPRRAHPARRTVPHRQRRRRRGRPDHRAGASPPRWWTPARSRPAVR